MVIGVNVAVILGFLEFMIMIAIRNLLFALSVRVHIGISQGRNR